MEVALKLGSRDLSVGVPVVESEIFIEIVGRKLDSAGNEEVVELLFVEVLRLVIILVEVMVTDLGALNSASSLAIIVHVNSGIRVVNGISWSNSWLLLLLGWWSLRVVLGGYLVSLDSLW